MSLLNLSEVTFSWDGSILLDQIDLDLSHGEHVGLLGRNGCGKSTLMKVLAGEIEADKGNVRRAKDLRVTRLAQEVHDGLDEEVRYYIGADLQFSEEDHYVGNKFCPVARKNAPGLPTKTSDVLLTVPFEMLRFFGVLSMRPIHLPDFVCGRGVLVFGVVGYGEHFEPQSVLFERKFLGF